jgi:ferredoxin
LIDTLSTMGYRVLGPKERDGAMVYDDIDCLPVGRGDVQQPGHYRLSDRGDQSRFGYNLGPTSWKQFLFPPEETLFQFRDGQFVSSLEHAEKMAFIGVRACELAAIAIQDRVFNGDRIDPGYAARREQLLLVAVNCSQASASCFCASTGDGPRVGAGADLVLTEVNPHDPYYLIEAQTPAGEALLFEIGGEEVAAQECEVRDAILDNTRQQMQRSLAQDGLADALLGALDHPHWESIAERCLACGNCTQVCPTCFCSSSREDVNPVTLEVSHVRRWDSCFTEGHSYTAGGVVHQSVKSRYRQWLTHKLASWELQFGVSGCTGCGRCISWCPVGIDLTAEVAQIRGEA